MSHESGTLRTRLLPAATACLVLLCVAPAGAQQPARAPATAPHREHVVRKGETLWDIARQYLNDPFLWRTIYRANRSTIRDPDLIFPAERLVIPTVGATVADDDTAQRATPNAAPQAATLPVAPATPAPSAAARQPAQTSPRAAAPPAASPPPAPAAATAKAAAPEKEPRTVFYRRPEAAAMDTLASLERPIVPATEFYSAAWLARPASLAVVARLVREVDPRTGRDQLSHSLHPQQSVFLKYRGAEPPQVGTELQLTAIGRRIGDWGSVVRPVAIVRVDSVVSSVVAGTIAQQFGAVEQGQDAVALPAYPGSASRAEPVRDGARGELVGFLEDKPLYGTMDIAFVSLGGAEGVKVGDQVEAYEPREKAHGEELPPVPLARMTVVRVGDRASTVRISVLTHAGLRAGLPVQLVARVP